MSVMREAMGLCDEKPIPMYIPLLPQFSRLCPLHGLDPFHHTSMAELLATGGNELCGLAVDNSGTLFVASRGSGAILAREGEARLRQCYCFAGRLHAVPALIHIAVAVYCFLVGASPFLALPSFGSLTQRNTGLLLPVFLHHSARQLESLAL